MPRATTTRSSASPGRRMTRRSRSRSAGSPASSTPTSTGTIPRPRRSSRRRRRPTRSSPTPSGGGPTTPTDTTACARAAGPRAAPGSASSRTSSRPSSGRRRLGDSSASAAAAPRPAATSAPGSRSTSPRCSRAEPRGRLRRRRRSASTAAATAPSRARRSAPASAASGAGQLRQVTRPRSARWCAPPPAPPAAETARSPRRPARSAAAAAAWPARAATRSTSPPGSSPASGSGSPAAGHAGEAGGAPGDLYVEVAVEPTTSASSATASTWSRRRVPATRAMLGGEIEVPTLDGEREVEVPAGSQPGDRVVLAASAFPRCGGRRGDQHVLFNVVVPATSTTTSASSPPARGDDRGREPEPTDDGLFSPARRGVRLIRLAVRCGPEAPSGCLPSCSSSRPGGVEEEQGPGWVEYAIYGAAGRAPRPRRARGGAGEGRSRSLDRGPRRLGRPLARLPQPVLAGGRVWIRPSWERRRAGGAGRRRDRPWSSLRHRRAPDDAPVHRVPGRARGRRRGPGGRSPTSAPARACLRSPPRSSASTRCWGSTTSWPRSRQRRRTPPRTASSCGWSGSTCARRSRPWPRPRSRT